MKKFLAIIMTLFVLLSSFTFRVGMHYCGGELSKVAFFEEISGCGADEKTCFPDNSDKESFSKSSCCDNDEFFVEGHQHNRQFTDSENIQPDLILVPSLGFLYETFALINKEQSVFQTYTPPLKPVDRPVLFQSFLI